MGIVALVVLTITLAWSAVVGGLDPSARTQLPVRHYWIESGRALSRLRPYQPPARKSMIVDTSGMAHPTADRTGMTKRDRSRPYLKLTIQPKTIEAAQVPTPPVPATGAPLFQMQTEEIPLTPPPTAVKSVPLAPKIVSKAPPARERELSLGRKVQAALMADNTLSRSAQLTVKVISIKNKVTLRGIVLDKEEKAYIGKKAADIAGPESVDNRLTVL